MTAADLTWWQNPAWIAAITGLAAVFFSFASLGFQKYLTTFQIKSALKEKWVKEFKDDLASYLTCSAIIHDLVEEGYDLLRAIEANTASSEDIENEKKTFADFRAHNRKAHELSAKISLFLSEKDAIHLRLIDALKLADEIFEEWKKELNKIVLNENKRKEIRSRGIAAKNQIRNAAREVITHELNELL